MEKPKNHLQQGIDVHVLPKLNNPIGFLFLWSKK